MDLIYNIFVKELYKFPLIIYNIHSSYILTTSSRDSKPLSNLKA